MNYIEFLENAGFMMTGDVGRQVELAPAATLIDFRERYLDLCKAFHAQTSSLPAYQLSRDGESQAGRVFDCPDSEPHEFRPLLHGRLMEFRGILGGDSGNAFDTLDLDKRLRRVKAMLLYAHGLVVSDSLFYINQFFTPGSAYIDVSRQQLKNYLTVIASLRPLIEAGILVVYPQYEHSGIGLAWVNGTHASFQDSVFDQWLKERYENDQDEDYLALIGHSHRYNELLFFATRYDGSVTLPSHPGYKHIQTIMADYAHRSSRSDVRRDSRLVTALATIDLENVDGMSLDDIISIRRASETFEQWRRLLSEAMKQIDNYELTSASAIVSGVQEIVAEGHAVIENEVQKSTVWQRAKGPIGKCTLSSMAGLLAKGAFDPATAGATLALSFVYDYMSGGTKRRAHKALRSHFASFTAQSE